MAEAIAGIDNQLAERISRLQQARDRLQHLAEPSRRLPHGVPEYIQLLERIGTDRHESRRG